MLLGFPVEILHVELSQVVARDGVHQASLPSRIFVTTVHVTPLMHQQSRAFTGDEVERAGGIENRDEMSGGRSCPPLIVWSALVYPSDGGVHG